MDISELKQFMIDLIDEEFGPKPVALAKRWSGGTIVLNPSGDTQPKEFPIEVFFKKLTGLRESLRVLEQKINGHEALSAEDRATFQSYITKCYGSMTSFNILFRDDKDKFVGSGGSGSSGEDEKPKMTMGEARKRLGLNEHGSR